MATMKELEARLNALDERLDRIDAVIAEFGGKIAVAEAVGDDGYDLAAFARRLYALEQSAGINARAGSLKQIRASS